MTDRLKGVAVTFEQDIRDDDAEKLIEAIRTVVGQFRGVASVTPLVADLDDHMARERVRFELQSEIYGALRGVFAKKV